MKKNVSLQLCINAVLNINLKTKIYFQFKFYSRFWTKYRAVIFLHEVVF